MRSHGAKEIATAEEKEEMSTKPERDGGGDEERIDLAQLDTRVLRLGLSAV
jgi:hypothetical protein